MSSHICSRNVNLQGDFYNDEFYEFGMINEGGFGSVFKAKHKLDGAFYAVKKIPFKSKNEEIFQKILREVKTLAALKHTNIVSYNFTWLERQTNDPGRHSSGESDSGCEMISESSNIRATLYIQMEYCDEDLRSLLDNRYRNNGRERWERLDTMDIFRQILCGVQHIHEKKIIHRDLKPDNIFISKNDVVKIGDFGLACFIHQTGDNCLHCLCPNEKTSKDLGTPPYAAPELEKREEYNFKVDIYGLGIILFELLYQGKDFYSEVERIINGEFPPYLMPDEIELIRKLIDVDPEKRPTATEILRNPKLKESAAKNLEELEVKLAGLQEEYRSKIAEKDSVIARSKEEHRRIIEQKDKVISSLRDAITYWMEKFNRLERQLSYLKTLGIALEAHGND